MKVVGVVSIKGGVGKTTISANLSAALAARLGAGRVTVVDLDPQNGLAWHFGFNAREVQGISHVAVGAADWHDVVLTSEFGVDCVPYGPVTEAEREEFERVLAADPNWIGSQLQAAGFDEDSVILIDTPPGHSVYLQQVLECGDLVLPVVLADAGSSATLPTMETVLSDATARRPQLESAYIVNQADPDDPLSRDVIDLLRTVLGHRLAPTQVHLDESVREALAFQQPVLSYDVHGQASHDLDRLAIFVIDILSR